MKTPSLRRFSGLATALVAGLSAVDSRAQKLSGAELSERCRKLLESAENGS